MTTVPLTIAPLPSAFTFSARVHNSKSQRRTSSTMAFLNPQEILTLYGLCLMLCGALAFQASGRKDGAMTALYVGNGAAAITFLTAAAVGNKKLNKGDPGYKLMMAGVHWALVYPLLLAGALSFRLYKAWGNPAKAYLIPYFVTMIVASVAVVAGIAVQKPKKATAEAAAGEAADKAKEVKAE